MVNRLQNGRQIGSGLEVLLAIAIIEGVVKVLIRADQIAQAKGRLERPIVMLDFQLRQGCHRRRLELGTEGLDYSV